MLGDSGNYPYFKALDMCCNTQLGDTVESTHSPLSGDAVRLHPPDDLAGKPFAPRGQNQGGGWRFKLPPLLGFFLVLFLFFLLLVVFVFFFWE